MSQSDPLSPLVLIGLNVMMSNPRANVSSPPRFAVVFPLSDVQAAPTSGSAATSAPRPSHRAHRTIGFLLVRRRSAGPDAPTRMLILQVARATSGACRQLAPTRASRDAATRRARNAAR